MKADNTDYREHTFLRTFCDDGIFGPDELRRPPPPRSQQD